MHTCRSRTDEVAVATRPVHRPPDPRDRERKPVILAEVHERIVLGRAPSAESGIDANYGFSVRSGDRLLVSGRLTVAFHGAMSA